MINVPPHSTPLGTFGGNRLTRDQLAERAHQLAERISLVPPATAQLVKDTLNHTGELMGKSDSWKYHFMAHQWMHNTATAAQALDERKAKASMKEVFADRDRGDRSGA